MLECKERLAIDKPSFYLEIRKITAQKTTMKMEENNTDQRRRQWNEKILTLRPTVKNWLFEMTSKIGKSLAELSPEEKNKQHKNEKEHITSNMTEIKNSWEILWKIL